jgi:hypothetical protein
MTWQVPGDDVAGASVNIGCHGDLMGPIILKIFSLYILENIMTAW